MGGREDTQTSLKSLHFSYFPEGELILKRFLTLFLILLTLPDLDGEMYLKQETGTSVDVNSDGVVNIRDLVIVANAFGNP